MTEAEELKVREFARWLEGLSGEDSNRALIALVSYVLSSFGREADKIRWINAVKKTMRVWVNT